MAKATTTQINYLRKRLGQMLDEKMDAWEKQNKMPECYTTAEIFKMLKKGTIKLRKEPDKNGVFSYGYSGSIKTYFDIPSDGREEWEKKRDNVWNAYKASITTIMDSFVLSGSDFTMALQAFEDLNIE